MLDRRQFLKGTSLVAATGFPYVAASAQALATKPGQTPRHIIHMVADGMSMGTLTCADHFSRSLRGRGLTWISLYNRPEVYSSWMNMRSLNSLVTDSSAAASSWGCGTRIINGMVNTMGDGTWLKTLYELFAEAGWKRGLVTTTEITHATPAGFAANTTNRDHAELIAAQYLDRRIDVLLGGGRKFLDPAKRKDKRNLKGDFASAGYIVMDKRQALVGAPLDRRWIGTFDASHLPYTIDQRQSKTLQEDVPTLAEMTRLALAKLERENHFILQVEGGRVDHACHSCDAASALFEQVAFDEAIDVCLEFQQRHPETLLLITTDHGNGNLGLNGTGSAYGKCNDLFQNALQVKASFGEILSLLKRKADADPDDLEKSWYDGRLTNPTPPPPPATPAPSTSQTKKDEAKKEEAKEIVATADEVVEIIESATGYKVPKKKAEMLVPFLSKKGSAMYDLMNGDTQQLGQLLGNYLGMGWAGNAHTADYVPVLASGPGAERFRGYIQNTDVFYHYLALVGIDFRNPTEPLLTQTGPEAAEVENPSQYA